jgi:hypothetical protein
VAGVEDNWQLGSGGGGGANRGWRVRPMVNQRRRQSRWCRRRSQRQPIERVGGGSVRAGGGGWVGSSGWAEGGWRATVESKKMWARVRHGRSRARVRNSANLRQPKPDRCSLINLTYDSPNLAVIS